MDKCAIKCFVRFIATNNPKLFSLPSSLPFSLSLSLSPPLSTVNTDTNGTEESVHISSGVKSHGSGGTKRCPY